MNRIRFHAALALILLLGSLVSGCIRPAFARRSVMAGSSDEMPLELTANRPFVEVHINGRGPYPFLLDSGAALMALPAPLAKELELERSGRTLMRLDSGMARTWERLDRVRLASVRLGALELQDVSAVVAPSEFVDTGILPTCLLRDYLVTIDFPGQELRIERSDLLASAQAFPFRYRMGVPCREIELQGQPLMFVVDTGLQGAMLLPEQEIERLNFKHPPVTCTTARTLNFTGLVRAGRLAGSIQLGQGRVDEPIVFFGSRNPMLGSGAMRHFVVRIDGRNRLLEFERTEGTPTHDPPLVGFGFWSEPASGGQRVSGVLPGSMAERAGLAEGDTILEITPLEVSNGTGQLPFWKLRLRRLTTGETYVAVLMPELIVP